MVVQLAIEGVRPDRHHREKKRPGHKQAQLFAFGKFIAPPRKRPGTGGDAKLKLVDLRTEYQKLKDLHAGEIE